MRVPPMIVISRAPSRVRTLPEAVQRHDAIKSQQAKLRSKQYRMRALPSHRARDLMLARLLTGRRFW